jgi:glycosyltransferase involved in cell wall biosynthesis
LKVAYLFGGLNRGGAETLALDVFRNTKNPDLSFICIHRKQGELLDAFNSTGVPVFRIKPKSHFDILYFFKIRKLLLSQNIDIVHTHQVVDSFIALLSTLLTGIKRVQTFHGHGYDYSLSMRFMRWCVLKFNNQNIFVSNSQKEYYQKKYRVPKKNCSVVYNGISFLKFDIPPGNNLRQKLGIGKETLLTGTGGSFASGRDQITICRFLKILSDSGINFKHLFIGGLSKPEPWRYQQCVDYCSENDLNRQVVFMGPRTDVPEILLQLDAFIYSTNHDTFSLALIEAIAAGIPVFANDWRVFVEITQNGKLAGLYKSKDEKDLFYVFSNFLNNKDLFRNKARDAAKIIKETFTIDAHIDGLTNLYNQITEKIN